MRTRTLILLCLAYLIALAVGISHAEAWYSKAWNDLKDNSEVILGENLAYGVCYDLTFKETLHGAKMSIYRYRKIHLEYGALTVMDKPKPFTHSLGFSLYLQPFLNWAVIPEKWKNIKNLYFGPVAGYDLHYWKGMIQLHHEFGGAK